MFRSAPALTSVLVALCLVASGPTRAEDDIVTATVMDLMVDGEAYAGQRVRVQGEAVKGSGNLRNETRRGKDDWVLRDECCDAWITAQTGAPPRPPDAKFGLDVVGRVQVEGSTVYIVAEDVRPTPPAPKPTVRLSPTRPDGGTFLQVCQDVVVRVNLIGDVPDVPLRWELSIEDEVVASGDVPFRYEGVPQREYEVTARLMFEHYLGMSRSRAERQLLGGEVFRTGEPGQRELHFELSVEEQETGKMVALGTAEPMADCAPPYCYYDRGCTQQIQ